MPWTRRLSNSMSLDQEAFLQAFLLALEDDKVIKKLQSGVIGQLQAEISHLKQVIQKRDDVITALQNDLSEVKDANDALEQYTRRNSLRISGLKELQDENPLQVILTFCNSRLRVKPEVTINDIDRVHRIGKPDQKVDRKLLVKFATYRVRQRVYAARVRLKPKNQHDPDAPWKTPTSDVAAASNGNSSGADADETTLHSTKSRDSTVPITTEGGNDDDDEVDEEDESDSRCNPDPIDLDVLRAIKAYDGQENIWINEDLTARRAYLLFQARKMKKSKEIIDCWSNDGNVLVKNKFRKIVPVHNIQMLNSVNNAGSNVLPHSQTQPGALS